MEIVDKLLEKIGNDKVLHFLGGAWICSLISFVVILQESGLTFGEQISLVSIGTIVVGILSVIKEYFDSKFDWWDIVAALLGCVTIFIAVLLGTLFGILSV